MTPKQSKDVDSSQDSSEYLNMRLDAYYYSFEATGVIEIDRILSAVATAGKHHHHTEDWGEEEEQAIQDAANDAAKALTEGSDLQLKDSEAKNG